MRIRIHNTGFIALIYRMITFYRIPVSHYTLVQVADHLQIELDNLAAGRADRDFGDVGAAGGGGGQRRGGSTPVHGGPILYIIHPWIITTFFILRSVFRIHDILVRIRIRGSMPLTSGSGFGCGSCTFCHWSSRRQQKIYYFFTSFSFHHFWQVHLHHFLKIKVQKKSQNSRNQLMTEGSGSGSGSIPLTSGSGSRRPKNMGIRKLPEMEVTEIISAKIYRFCQLLSYRHGVFARV